MNDDHLTTSVESYKALNESGQAGECSKAVFECIKASGKNGVTCFEIERILSMKHETASGRIWDLRTKRALIFAEGTRKNPDSGRRCEVLRVVDDLEYAKSVDPRCGNDKNRTLYADVKVVGIDEETGSEEPVTLYEFECEGEKAGQTTVNIIFPEAITCYPGDQIQVTWRFKP